MKILELKDLKTNYVKHFNSIEDFIEFMQPIFKKNNLSFSIIEFK